MQPTAQKEYSYIDLSKFGDGIHHWELYSRIRTTERLDTTDITGIADNLIAYQNQDGGWPKNIDWLAVIDPDSVMNDLSERYRESTFDNRNIFPQIEYLSAVYLQTGEEKYCLAAEKGFQYILEEEYPAGGWRGWDADVITFNDDVMTGIMNLLLDVKVGHEYYSWLETGMRKKLMEAYERGLQVILNCQIIIKEQKTAWCQQHDFETYAPARGRSYEHPSVTANESCDIILFLMRIPEPDSTLFDAIESAVKWLEEVKITGYRYDKIPIKERPYHESTVDFDRVLVVDSTAPPVWARYYDLKNSKPFLSRRDGSIVYELSEISFDRRIGYQWYGYWPERVLKAYTGWKNP
jgi:PelA/Pel-15E family pectate lyase